MPGKGPTYGELLVDCDDCKDLEAVKEMLVTAETEIAELARQRVGLEHNLRRSASAEAALRQELAKAREDDPSSDEIRDILKGWHMRHPNKRIPMTGDRAKATRKARKWFSPAELKTALAKMAEFPFVVYGKRSATGSDNDRRDDPKFAFQSEVTVEELLACEKPAPKVKLAPPPPNPLPVEEDLQEWCAALARHTVLQEALQARRGWSLVTLRELGVGWDGRRLTLPVRDQSGALVNVLRYASTRKPKMVAEKGWPRDLFPAPESLKAPELWVVEGEPDAITAREMGLPAVGAPGIAVWRDEWAVRFTGRKVYVLFDCDDSGRKGATRVASSLVTEAAEVRIVDLDPSRTDSFDLGDFWVAGGSAAALQLLVHEAGSVRRLAS